MKNYNILYLVKKIYVHIIEKIVLSKFKIDKNLFYKGKINKKIQKILIYLENPYYAHLGDQLFFEPLINNLVLNGYEVEVAPTKLMEKYFRQLGYTIRTKRNLEDYDLVITRSDFFEVLKKNNNILYFQTVNLSEKLCDAMIKQVFEFLKTYLDPIYPNKPNVLKFKQKKYNEILNASKKNIIYSNYLDSGGLLNNKKNMLKLEAYCKKKRDEGFNIIHLGSLKNKTQDKNQYNYIDCDLRGKTNIEDLFNLISDPRIEEYIGFDGFLMHLFLIYNKKVNVCVRNKITKKRKEKIIKFVNPPYKELEKSNILYL